jgi:hypothetical protein
VVPPARHLQMQRGMNHIDAKRVWAFVHGKGDLQREDFAHLHDCKRCESVFMFFALYSEEEQSGFESCDDGAPVSGWTEAEQTIK